MPIMDHSRTSHDTAMVVMRITVYLYKMTVILAIAFIEQAQQLQEPQETLYLISGPRESFRFRRALPICGKMNS